MLTLEERIIQNLEGRVSPVTAFIAVSGIVDMCKGLEVLNNLVKTQVVEVIKASVTDTHGKSSQVPMYRYIP